MTLMTLRCYSRMKIDRILNLLFFCAWMPLLSAHTHAGKSRVIVLTDISNEPDDEQSLVRFLVCSNEFEIEGLVATTSVWLKHGVREDLIHRQIAAYSKARQNLVKHAPGYPEAASLTAVTRSGQAGYGMQSVGPGKLSPGSQQIINAIARPDDRPLWICIWGGANTLAQALSELREKLSDDQMKAALGKLRVYAISDQDDAGLWLRTEFPDLFYIVSPSPDPENPGYALATWSGISGDRHYKNGPGYQFHLVENPWLEQNIINNHGPLGALYPKVKFIMEGDTPSFLGLISNGLGWEHSPSYGGWGGRYILDQPAGESRKIWTNQHPLSRDTLTIETGRTISSDHATIWRWREHFQHDFAARMDWCVAPTFEEANHHPVAVLNGDRSKHLLRLDAMSGADVKLSARGTTDPDHHPVRLTWWIYQEAGNIIGGSLTKNEGMETAVRIPRVEKAGNLHVILQCEDFGKPSLTAYRRMIINVSP